MGTDSKYGNNCDKNVKKIKNKKPTSLIRNISKVHE